MLMSKTAPVATLLLFALLLAGCGRKGALFMPVKSAPVANVQPEQKPDNANLPVQSQPVPTPTESQKQP